MTYLAYTNMHYVLGEAYEDRKPDYFFLMKQGGKDVHRIHKSCIESPASKPVPCDVMSGDFHGNGEHHNWFERVDAALLDDCEKIDNECIGKYKKEDDEKFEIIPGTPISFEAEKNSLSNALTEKLLKGPCTPESWDESTLAASLSAACQASRGCSCVHSVQEHEG